MPPTATQWLALLRQHRLLPPERDNDAASLAASWPPDRDFLQELERRGLLTAFQRGKIAKNRPKELVLGPYVLIELLGEGGAGQVYKARHTLLNRLAAVKILRPDRLGAAELERFQREMQTAAKLSHPNIVLTYDAVQAGDHLVYAMELVAGTDLSKLVKERGPLPIDQACALARQAALGLQHIHEHGLVHRDIKPGNLLLAKQTAGPPLLKVADLGLARLQSAWSSDTDLTATGAVMGTPDYMPPEQAVDPRGVDIRGDIYSLGCTLYFLLTGQVPFPGGSLAQKIAWQQHAEPAPVEQIRKDVPAALAEVVRRLLAKKPAQRYQTPAEAAAALAPFAGNIGSNSGAMLTSDTIAAERNSTMSSTGSSRGRLWLLLGAGVLVAALAVVLVLVFKGDRTPGPAPGSTIQVQLTGWLRPADLTGVVFLLDDKTITPEELEKTVGLLAGKHVLVLQRDGKEVERREFEVTPDLHLGKLVLPEPDAPVGPLHVLRAGDEVTSIGYSGDALRLLAVGPGAADGIHVWETPTGRLLYHLVRPKAGKAMKGVPVSGALSPEGNVALMGHLGAYKGSKQRAWFRALGLESKTVQIENEHSKTVGCVTYSRDGKLALSACEAGETRIWDAVTWTKKFQHDGNVACFTPDGSRVVTARGKIARLWPLAEAKPLLSFEGHEDVIRSLVCSPDGRHLLTGGDVTARLWDLVTGQEVRKFKGHEKEVTSVAFSPDGRRALTGSRDHTVRLWNVIDGQEILKFTQHTEPVTSVAYSPGGRRAASGSLDGSVRVWALPP